jgi:UDP-N-acetylglucosamine diphosphorylase/glucosamine-1-phosphate N-acetyltransferase
MGSDAERVAVIILAAGLGTRMQSDKAKVLHEVCGVPMILHVLQPAVAVAGGDVVVVVGHQADKVREVVSRSDSVRFAIQSRQLGTGHAVLCALPEVDPGCGHAVILCGDVPLLRTETIRRLIEDHRHNDRSVTVLAMEVDNPSGYGRILEDGQGRVHAIVEESDADDAQRRIRRGNTGIYCVATEFLAAALQRIRTDNAQGELYLTDIVAEGHKDGVEVGMIVADDPDEFHGVNSLADLQKAEALMKAREISS